MNLTIENLMEKQTKNHYNIVPILLYNLNHPIRE